RQAPGLGGRLHLRVLALGDDEEEVVAADVLGTEESHGDFTVGQGHLHGERQSPPRGPNPPPRPPPPPGRSTDPQTVGSTKPKGPAKFHPRGTSRGEWIRTTDPLTPSQVR